MIAKTFEVRDSGTFIPVMAVQMGPQCEGDRYLLARAGFGRDSMTQKSYVTVLRIDGGDGQATSDPYEWRGGARTMPEAHKYIIKNFDALQSGDVIDVQYILGETKEKKLSEALDAYI